MKFVRTTGTFLTSCNSHMVPFCDIADPADFFIRCTLKRLPFAYVFAKVMHVACVSTIQKNNVIIPNNVATLQLLLKDERSI